MKKAVFVATIKGFLNFEKNDIKILHELGYEVHIATDLNVADREVVFDVPVIEHQIDFSRNPLKLKNIKAYNQLKKLFNSENFAIIHCHTPVASVLSRIAGRKCRLKGTKLIYTAHGFHFFEGAPRKNWLLFYNAEKLCAKWTDVLITINNDDYHIAQKKKLANKVVYVPGVGIDLDRFSYSQEKRMLTRKQLMLDDEIMLLSVGELSSRKNHIAVIDALKSVEDYNFKYFIVGNGDLKDELEEHISSLNLQDKIKLLGRRNDIQELCNAADLFVFPSKQEGLPVALMEAIACHCPVIVSDIRGNRDLVSKTLFRFSLKDNSEQLTKLLHDILNGTMQEQLSKSVKTNYQTLIGFSKECVQEKMKALYKDL